MAVALSLWCGPALAETVALLPTSGSANIDSRSRLDVALRKALGRTFPGLVVQSAKETGVAMSTLIDLNGEVCENEDAACLSKLGILADVTTIVIVEASGKKTLEVDITVIDVEGAVVKRTAEGEVRLTEAGDADTLVRRAFGAVSEVPRIIDTAPTTKTTTTEPAPTLPTGEGPIDESELTDLQFAGATVGGIGGGVAVLGLLGALTCEAIFWTGTGPAATRKDVIAPLGSVLWIGAIVGAVAAGVGGGLYLAGSPDEARSIE